MSEARQAAERAAEKLCLQWDVGTMVTRPFSAPPEFVAASVASVSEFLEAEFSLLLAAKDAEIGRLKKWVADLHSGMYINCVYCGHRYGPRQSTPDTMEEVLRRHVEQCPEHPLSIVTAERDRLAEQVERWRNVLTQAGQLKHAYFGDMDPQDFDGMLQDVTRQIQSALEGQPHA